MVELEKLLGKKIKKVSPVSGGCIGANFRVESESGTYFVKKYNSEGISVKESNGLKELRESEAICTPCVKKVTDDYLVLEYIEQGSPGRNFQSVLGENLAAMHMKTSDKFGFYEDNFIGSTPQINTYMDNWIDFYIRNRLDNQIQLCSNNGYMDIVVAYKKLREKIPEILKDSSEEPVLIHGDLWGGNVICNKSGEPVLIDPAAYYGNRELELAMTKLFGGFTSDFYRSYERVRPLKKGWQKRENLYKLYHILNHLNLFGTTYKNQALKLMNSYV